VTSQRGHVLEILAYLWPVLGPNAKPTPILMSLTKKPKAKTKFLFNINYKTFRVFRGRIAL